MPASRFLVATRPRASPCSRRGLLFDSSTMSRRASAASGDSRPVASPRFARGPCSLLAPLDLRQRHALLPLVLAAAVLVRGFTGFIRFEKDHLGHALVGVDLRRKRRGVGKLQGHVAFPFGL